MGKFLLLLCICPIFSFAQKDTIPLRDGHPFYESIDTVNATKSELYDRSKIWFVNTFHSAKAVLQMDDKDAGIIMGKALNDLDFGNIMIGSADNYIHYTINITLKDDKYRIQIYDIYSATASGNVTYTIEGLMKYPKMNRRRLNRINESILSVINGYKAAISKKGMSDF